MAVVERLSGVITDRDASPRVKIQPYLEGRLKEVCGTLETVSGDSIGSTYRLFQVPSNARISQLLLYSDDIGTTTIADFGIYQTTANGGAVVDADFFGSAVSLKDGALNGSDITHESAIFGLEDMEKPLWEALGLSADSNRFYDVVATLTAAADAAATLSALLRYV